MKNASKFLAVGLLILLATSVAGMAAADAEATSEINGAAGNALDGRSITFAEVIAAMGGLVIFARLVVKLTPTPADDSALAKVIEVLKHVGLHIPPSNSVLAFLFLPLLLSGCAMQQTCAVRPDGTRETFSQVVWFQKSTTEGMKVHRRLPSGSGSALEISSQGTETQLDQLNAAFQAGVNAAKTAAK